MIDCSVMYQLNSRFRQKITPKKVAKITTGNAQDKRIYFTHAYLESGIWKNLEQYNSFVNSMQYYSEQVANARFIATVIV